MCGISGIINRNNYPVDYKEIKRQTDLVFHRGPDDEGYYFGTNFAFGHRRLAILDLSRAGRQPMSFMGKYVLIHNGEIFNYVELKEELEKEGYQFQSTSDTEVILAAYDRWGTDCVSRFNGMWAFALYDSEKQIIFCSRDRFGIKPFYYLDVGGKFIFGSEIKQLLYHLPQNYVNQKVLICYLITRYQEHNNETFFHNVFKLSGSHNLIYNLRRHNYRIERYYDIHIQKDIAKLTETESINSYKREILRAVKIRMRSDVKLGTCLSGGIDSSSVATLGSSLYRDESNGKFNAITAKCTDKRFDETSYAEIVADHADLEWHMIKPTTVDFINSVDEVIYTQEEPFNGPSIFMQYFVFKKAKELECTVMLDGQGGDETLLGYEKYLPAGYLHYFRTQGLLKTLSEINNTRKNNKNMPLPIIAFYTAGSFFPSFRRKEHLRRCFFLKRKYFRDLQILDQLADAYFDVNRLQIMEIQRTNLPILLRHEDRNSMRHSIESRLPFLDYQTLETALSVSVKYKIKGGWTKYLLRKSMEGYMPNEILWRKNKIGFNAPEEIWLSAHREGMIQAIKGSRILNEIAHTKKLAEHFSRLDRKLQWRVFNIAKWEQLYNVALPEAT